MSRGFRFISFNTNLSHTKSLLLRAFLSVLLLLFVCEVLIYYLVISQCYWPLLDPKNADPSIPSTSLNREVRAILLADTHLLGSRNGHWFDKLRREWQMYRAFQTSMTLFNSDLVFVLGDLFDEGLWCGESEFTYYINRFHSLFSVPEGTRMFVVVGNHDIGFHYAIRQFNLERFNAAFDSKPVQLLSFEGNHFVLINSMAMEGDGCFLCQPAERQLLNISNELKCAKGIGKCPKFKAKGLKQYSRPILLQHFPLYRESDEECSEPDEAPSEIKSQKFRERWECLSKESSDMLLEALNPRLVVTGHTHHGCHRYHKSQNTHEYTIPSFSWRNKNNPSFMMAMFTPSNYAVTKCYIPEESTVILLYSVGSILIILYLAYFHQGRHRRDRFFKFS